MPSEFSYHFQRGWACYRNADFEAAVREFSQAIEIDPASLDAYLFRAVANEECGNPADSRKDYETILHLDSESAQSHFARAKLLFEEMNRNDRDLVAIYTKVEDLCSRAIQLDPHLRQACFYRAEMRRELGNLMGALKDLNRSIELDPAFSFAYFQRAFVKGKIGDLRGAIRDLEYYLELPIGATRNRQVMKNIAAYWHQLSMQVEA